MTSGPSPAAPETIQPDIHVSVQVRHLPQYSTPYKQFFQYLVTINNRTDESWQLLARHWEITDSTGQVTVVDGEGVVGEQPLLPPKGSYTYDSFVSLEAWPGRMGGYYIMRDAWGVQVRVRIPDFGLSLAERVLN